MLQALGLIFHGFAILFYEFGEDELQQSRPKRQPAKNIPAGNNVDAAVVASDGSHRSQAREPVLSRLDGFIALIGENKINGRRDGLGIGVHSQQLVGRAIRTGSVGAHAEAHGNRLEILMLLVDAVAAAPPPRLVNERAVRGIHEADDAVIDAAWQVGGEVGDFVFAAKSWDARRRNWGVRCFGESGTSRRRLRDEDPNVVVVLLAGIATGVNAVDSQTLIASEGWNGLTLAGVGIEAPAVVTALDLLTVEVGAGKRHAAVRTGVAQGERFALAVAAQHEGRLQQCGFLKAATKLAAGHGAVPEAIEHQRVGGLALKFEISHGEQGRVAQTTISQGRVPSSMGAG